MIRAVVLGHAAHEAHIQDFELGATAAAGDGPLAVHEDVRRLDIAVDEAVLVGVLQAEGRHPHVLAGFRRTQRAVVFHQPREIATLDVLHRQIEAPGRFPRVEELDDVRVVELAGGLGFALVAPQHRLVRHQLRPHDFEGDQSGHAGVEGPVDLAHAPFADFFEDEVLAEEQFRDAPELDFAVLVAGEHAEGMEGFGERSVFRTDLGEGLFHRSELIRVAAPPVAEGRQQRIGGESFHTARLPP